MHTAINQISKKRTRIADFRGLHHAEVSAPGEWYDACNISAAYPPLLTPRRSRECCEEIENSGFITSLIRKKGYSIYANASGSIREKGAMMPIRVSQSGAPYRLIETGQSILAIGDEEAGYIRYGKETPADLKHWTFHPFFHYQLQTAAIDGEGALTEPGFYALTASQAGVYTGTVYDKAGNELTRQAVGTGAAENFDAQAAHFLNLGFRYCVENDEGDYEIINIAHLSTQSEIAQMSVSQYFISAADKKLYRFDAPSGAVYEVTTPYIAMFVRAPSVDLPAQGESAYPSAAPPPASEQGEYVYLEIGPSINLTHPLAWDRDDDGFSYHQAPLFRANLRVIDYLRFDSADQSVWRTRYGWDFAYVFDYSDKLLSRICAGNMIHDAEHYARDVSAAGISVLRDLNFEGGVHCADCALSTVGTQKLYPRYLRLWQEAPQMAVAVEHNNRVWCADNATNEIRACALGRFNNWEEYRGLVSDSFALACASEGDFTAAFALDEYLYFLKEHAFTMLYGNQPANFHAHTESDWIGMEAADAESLQIIGKQAYYKGIDGKIYCFNGSDIHCISDALGDMRFRVLSSAHERDKYYLLVSEAQRQYILVYHLQSGIWLKEDAQDIYRILNTDGRAAALMQTLAYRHGADVLDTRVLWLAPWEVTAQEASSVEWFCESGLLGLENDHYQLITDCFICFESERGATLQVLAKCGEDSFYTPLASFVSQKTATKKEKIKMKRCPYFRLKLQGKGWSKIFAVGYSAEQGSDK